MIWRVMAATLGALLVYIAFFLREDQEGRIENWLVVLWKVLDERLQHVETSFRTVVEKLGTLSVAFFDRILGPQTIAMQSFGVTACLVTGITIVLQFSSDAFSGNAPASHMIQGGFLLIVVALLPGIYQRPWATWIAVCGAGLVIAVSGLLWWRPDAPFALLRGEGIKGFFFAISNPEADDQPELDAIFAFFGGIIGASALLCIPIDLAWVGINRSLIRRAVQHRSSWALIIWNVVNVSFVGILVFAILTTADQTRRPNMLTMLYDATLIGRILVAAVSLIMLAIFAVVLINRAIWPIASMLTSPLRRFGLFRNRKVVGTLGTALIFNPGIERIVQGMIG